MRVRGVRVCVCACAWRGVAWRACVSIPNYDDIRGELGFKNVSLGNVLSASSSSEKITFLTEADEVVFREWRGKSFEVQVAIHELLGHGSGKLLKETGEGMRARECVCERE